MDGFDDIRGIISTLRLAGHQDQAQQIDDAFKGASTGGELWGGVIYELLKIKRDYPKIYQLISERGDFLINQIESQGFKIRL